MINILWSLLQIYLVVRNVIHYKKNYIEILNLHGRKKINEAVVMFQIWQCNDLK
jgi:hypothetical protein